ncbi:hypothetical protein EXIGLDRAFT_736333 [Exidia glandulosa HHB12029]|uniref:Uncharacterized protein n=1 Tax=Exidia glandulosa HHB12029 TaxID=1314781 RepID=A0A166N8E6_EXIGL|nr:hypothetical protein EXIGLDRAFT_736333 [Exidia glandulosa HHB12029]
MQCDSMRPAPCWRSSLECRWSHCECSSGAMLAYFNLEVVHGQSVWLADFLSIQPLLVAPLRYVAATISHSESI